MLCVRACGVGKRVDLGKLGLVCDSCGPCAIRVGLRVSPPLHVPHQYQHHPASLKGESVLLQFDWVESQYFALLNINMSMTFHCCGEAKSTFCGMKSR